ncbi:unnamed protein product, partial [Prorocentrum cordatum]
MGSPGGAAPPGSAGAAAASVLEVAPGEDAEELFFRLGYTDGLPVLLPTRARVRAMLRGTALGAGDVLGRCPPSLAEVTVEKLAIAAVMAGCTPEMFRIVVAAAKAMLLPEFGLHPTKKKLHATTMGATPVVVVNGPCRHAAAVNFRHGACGSGSRSTSIGRALKLLVQNVGRSKLAGTESTTIGTPMKFGLCFAEWEERCGAWEPLSVAQGGAGRGEDAVTVMAASSGPVQLVDFFSGPWELVRLLGHHLAGTYSPSTPLVNNCLLVISPEHYDTLLKAGMDSKQKLARALWKESSRHMVRHLPAILVRLGKLRASRVPSFVFRALGCTLAAVGFFMSCLGRPPTLIPKYNSPESFQIVVAGGEAGKFSSLMPGFGVGRAPMSTADMSRPVTARVEARPAALDAAPPPSGHHAGGAPGDLLRPGPEA